MEERNYYVYRHTSPSGKVYIGITQQNPPKPWGSGTNYDYNTHFINAIKNMDGKILPMKYSSKVYREKKHWNEKRN